jgi:hypothetical protein
MSDAAKAAAAAADEALKTGQSGAPLPPVPGSNAAKSAGRIPSSPPITQGSPQPPAGGPAASPPAAGGAAFSASGSSVAPSLPTPSPDGGVAFSEPAAVAVEPVSGEASELEQDEIPAPPPSAGKMPPFPTAAVRAAADAVVAWVRAWPQNTKIIVGVSSAAVLILLIVLAIIFSGPSTEDAYVQVSHGLIEVPLDDDRFADREVERGELVEVLDRTEEFALVRNRANRVGWIKGAFIAPQPAPIAPDSPFAMCRRRWVETDGTACQMRGQAQLEACQSSCEGANELAACLRGCDRRMEACSATCALLPGEGLASDDVSTGIGQPTSAAVGEPDTAEPGDVDAPAATHLEPAAEPEPEPMVEPVPEPATKPAKKKKKKRKKRKKRKKH